MTDFKVLGDRLKSLRKEKMLTLQQLAEKSEISAGYISKIERGTVCPSVKNIQKLSFALGVTANELMIDQPEIEKRSSVHAAESYVVRRKERLPIFGITDLLNFESVCDDIPNFKLNVMTLAGEMKGQYYSTHSYDEFGIVAKGRLGLELDGTQYELEEGECVMIRANTNHAVTNCSSEECVSYWLELIKK